MKKLDNEMEMDAFFNTRKNTAYQPLHTQNSGYRKVADKPEIINIQGLNSGPSGSLKVTTTPPGAEFYLINGNGNEIDFGATPVTITDMDPGSYDYIVRMPDYTDYQGTTTIQDQFICCLNIDLDKPEKTGGCSPITGQPPSPPAPSCGPTPGYIILKESQFWGGVGFLAGLTIATIIYLILRKKD